MRHMFIRMMNMLGITFTGFRLYWEEGYGAAISGGLQGAGTALAGYWAAEQAKEDRKTKTKQFNAENLLSIDQFNMDQNRLAGLGGVFSGAAAMQEATNRGMYFNADGSVNTAGLANSLGGTAGDSGYITANAPVTGTDGTAIDSNAALIGQYNNALAAGNQNAFTSNYATNQAKNTAQSNLAGLGDYKNLDASAYSI